jgi:hypothetical protein
LGGDAASGGDRADHFDQLAIRGGDRWGRQVNAAFTDPDVVAAVAPDVFDCFVVEQPRQAAGPGEIR